ncbi:MAG: hypothetical protein KC912_21180, partial [Proteobacteria bacterium]|nr:hypothetical protein [Pseudomonadota bacterium]
EDQVVSVQLADRRPDLAVRNHGVPGYGTLQSQALEASVGQEAVVVYGLIDLHDARNAGAWSWLAGLERASRGQAWVQSPAAWWDGEALQYGEPTGYRHWELSESVALVALVERSVIAVHDRFLRTKSETTVRLVMKFRDQVEARGGRFAVALLHAPQRESFYLRRLGEEGVELLDLRHEAIDRWSLADGHPDARVHADWAERLAETL